MNDTILLGKGHSSVSQTIKQLIWLYLLLLIFEGALRKWILPGLATPLLVVRDPVAIAIIFLAIYHKLLNWNIYYLAILFISGIAFSTTLLFGHGNLTVAVFGLRALILHFPLIFIIGTILNEEDVEQIGKMILWIVPFMTVLVVLQFYSPQNAWVNRGIGGDLGGAGFSGALGYFRPPATFSFTNGNALFYSFAFSFVAYFWMNRQRIGLLLLSIATICALLAIPLSISRAYYFQIIITLCFVAVASLINQRNILPLVGFSVVGIFSFLLLTQFDSFQTGVEVFEMRLEQAKDSEGGVKSTLVNRFLKGDLITPFLELDGKPLSGYGLGLGTNAGSALTTGKRQFLLSEGEWGRILGEMGIIMGALLIFLRLLLGLELTIKSFEQLFMGNILPWVLLSFGLIQITIAGWAQPTSLGFSVFTAGLVLASLNKSTNVNY